MGFPVDEHFGLVLRFVDFEYLPDLLRRIRVGDEPETLRAWARLLDDAGYTDIDDDSDTTPPQLASDAMRLCKGLELLDDEGPTAAGANMARLADTPPEERGEEYDEGLGGILADRDTNPLARQRAFACIPASGWRFASGRAPTARGIVARRN